MLANSFCAFFSFRAFMFVGFFLLHLEAVFMSARFFMWSLYAPAQAKTLLYSLEQATAGIGLHVDAHKTEYMCFNQTGDISTLDGSSLKLVDKFTYLGSSVSSTEKDIDTRLTKAWTALDRLAVI